MSIITIPLWLFLLSVGLPVVSLTALVIGLIRAKLARRRNRVNQEIYPTASFIDRHAFSSDISKMILDQQIDAVFLSLSTIIETEKVKLKALVGGQNIMEPIEPIASGRTSETFETFETFETAISETSGTSLPHPPETDPIVDTAAEDTPADNDIRDTIAAKALEGMTPREIARDLGLSLSEVVLALRMKNGFRGPKTIGGRLEAVA